MRRVLAEYHFEDILIQYIISENNAVELYVIPDIMKLDVKLEKKDISDSLVQLKLSEDDFPYGFANGHTMRNCASVQNFHYVRQEVVSDEGSTCVITRLENQTGQRVDHILEHKKKLCGISLKTVFYNNNENEVSLEMLSSFSLGGITPFMEGEATDDLLVHRLRSKWSSEGRLETRSIEELQLEPTWTRWGVNSEKFGQVGSLPVRRYFPFVAIEDIKNEVVWAVQLGIASSWQMEVYRREEKLCISGGIADFDFGHWCKTLKKGESFETPTAYMTVCCGNLDEASQRLTAMQNLSLKDPKCLTELPIVFNEFCTTWGNPSHTNICNTLDAIKGKGMDYFVIDAGWYADPIKGWEGNMGDWEVADFLFPEGLEKTVEEIKNAGLKPGIWFEIEVVGHDAKAFLLTDHLLKRRGRVITAGSRRFWDMRDTWTEDYLTQRIIGFLLHYGFQYLKVDYNESIGVGCDGAESLGEGLRQNMLASEKFFEKIRREVPGVVIEICASGGHRLEPSMMALGDFASFSDAHEEKEIPIIAANVHRAILPKQSLIWAVIRTSDTQQRIVYSIINTFLGVMCLSGDMCALGTPQWEVIDEGISFYRNISNVILDGQTHFFGTKQNSYRKLSGWQGILRYGVNKEVALLIIHYFADGDPERVYIPTEVTYEIKEIYQAEEHKITVQNNLIMVLMKKPYDAVAIHLIRNPSLV